MHKYTIYTTVTILFLFLVSLTSGKDNDATDNMRSFLGVWTSDVTSCEFIISMVSQELCITVVDTDLTNKYTVMASDIVWDGNLKFKTTCIQNDHTVFIKLSHKNECSLNAILGGDVDIKTIFRKKQCNQKTNCM
jgi:hypothetical protein